MPNSVLDTLKLNYAKEEMARRNQIYNIYWRFYLGIQYELEWVRRYYRLYAGIREFYSMIARAVDIDVQLVPGGWLTAPLTAQDAVDDVLSLSDWRVNGSLLIHNGAICGDFYLKCVEDEDGIKSIQPLDPRGVWLTPDFALFIRDMVDIETGLAYEHGEVIDAANVYIYKDGELIETYDHSFGQVPVFYGQNKNVGLIQGLNSFHNVLDEINAVNEMATLMQEAGIRTMNTQKVIVGASAEELTLGPDKIIFLPQGASLDELSNQLKVGDMLKFLQDVYNKTRSNLPEMIFDALGNASDRGSLFSPNRDSLEFVAQELIVKINRMRLGYDKALAQAINLCDPTIGEWEFDPDRLVLDIEVQASQETPEVPTVETTQTVEEQTGD